MAIARALVCEPEIILADEPTGALDSRTGVEIMELFKSLHAEGQTVILITHNQELADEAQRVVRIADGLIQEMEREMCIRDSHYVQQAYQGCAGGASWAS